jgi:hypothetical protein
MVAMKLFRHIRSKSKLKEKDHGPGNAYPSQYFHPTGKDVTSRLPIAILQTIFVLLCPLTVDDSYDSSEESLVGYGCALCDLRSLAHCALVSMKWCNAAQYLMYAPILLYSHLWPGQPRYH